MNEAQIAVVVGTVLLVALVGLMAWGLLLRDGSTDTGDSE